jgi:hypothetical protein
MTEEIRPEAVTDVPPVPMVGDDPEAPYGRKADGTARSRPGRKPGQRSGTGQSRARTSTKAPALVDYKTPILGLFQIPAGALAIAGMQRPVLLADSAAVTIHAEPIATALDQLAHERPEVAAVLDRILQVGPYGVLIAAVAPLALQLLSNHSILPPGTMGTIPPTQLVANFVGPEAAAKMAEQQAMRDFENRNGQESAPDGNRADIPA